MVTFLIRQSTDLSTQLTHHLVDEKESRAIYRVKDELTVEERDGDPVTMEAFVQWKERFDAERKKSNNNNLTSSEGGVKLTGEHERVYDSDE